MKRFIISAVVALSAATAVPTFAQSTQGLTRAQVKGELKQLEDAGYRPNTGEDPYYPADIQAAEAKVHARDAGKTAYGGVTNDGTAQSGAIQR